VVELALDTLVRNIVINHRLQGKKVVISIGSSSLAEGDFETLMPTGIIAGVRTEVGRLILTIKDPLYILEKTKITGYWVGQHPLDAIEDILANKVGLDSSMYQASDFTPSTYTAISHYTIARLGVAHFYDDLGMNEPENALDVINQLAELVNGMLYVDENGKIRFKIFDATAATAADWTTDEIGPVTVVDLNSNFVNRIEVATSDSAEGRSSATLQRNDTTSQTNYAWPGTSERIIERKFKNPWLQGYTYILSDWTNVSPAGETSGGAADGDTVSIRGGFFKGLCGTRWTPNTYPTGAQEAEAKLTSSRTMYLLIDDEIVEIDQLNVSTTPDRRSIYDPEADQYDTGVKTPNAATIRIKKRGALGTTPAAHTGDAPFGRAVDLTIAFDMANERLNRFADGGAPLIKVPTSFAEFNKEPGDLVSLTTNGYADFGADGLTSARKFEIVGKSTEWWSSPPRLVWTLAEATTTANTRDTGKIKTGQAVAQFFDAPIPQGNVGESHVISGMAVAIATGFDVTVSTGDAGNIIGQRSLPEQLTVTVNASVDTYVYFDLEMGGISVIETALGAGVPTTSLSNEIILAKVVSDGSGVTSVTELKPTKALDGHRLVAETVQYEQMGTHFSGGFELSPNGHLAIPK